MAPQNKKSVSSIS